MARFNITMVQITEMFQWAKCLNEKYTVLDKPNYGKFLGYHCSLNNTKWEASNLCPGNRLIFRRAYSLQHCLVLWQCYIKVQINMKSNESGVRWCYVYDCSVSSLLQLLCWNVLSFFTHFSISYFYVYSSIGCILM